MSGKNSWWGIWNDWWIFQTHLCLISHTFFLSENFDRVRDLFGEYFIFPNQSNGNQLSLVLKCKNFPSFFFLFFFFLSIFLSLFLSLSFFSFVRFFFCCWISFFVISWWFVTGHFRSGKRPRAPHLHRGALANRYDSFRFLLPSLLILLVLSGFFFGMESRGGGRG